MLNVAALQGTSPKKNALLNSILMAKYICANVGIYLILLSIYFSSLECVAGFSSAARPLQKALDELLGAGKVTGEPLDGSVLRSALAQEKTGLDQQRARCEWLQRQCLLLHKVMIPTRSCLSCELKAMMLVF